MARFAGAVLRLGLSLFLAFLLAALAVVAAIHLAVGREAVIVPDLVGLSVDRALERAGNLGLALRFLERGHSAEVPEGRVMSQRPLPGQVVKVGRPIGVTISLGPRERRVPDLTGVPLRQAEMILRSAGLELADLVEVPREGTPRGVIVGQEPAPGDPVADPPRVALLVADGRGENCWVMPDLIGRSLDEAVRDLTDLGLVISRATEEKRVPGAPPGVVVGQRPLAGYAVEGGGEVELVVNPKEEEGE